MTVIGRFGTAPPWRDDIARVIGLSRGAINQAVARDAIAFVPEIQIVAILVEHGRLVIKHQPLIVIHGFQIAKAYTWRNIIAGGYHLTDHIVLGRYGLDGRCLAHRERRSEQRRGGRGRAAIGGIKDLGALGRAAHAHIDGAIIGAAGRSDVGRKQADVAANSHGNFGGTHLKIGGREHDPVGTAHPNALFLDGNIITRLGSKAARAVLLITGANAFKHNFRHRANG